MGWAFFYMIPPILLESTRLFFLTPICPCSIWLLVKKVKFSYEEQKLQIKKKMPNCDLTTFLKSKEASIKHKFQSLSPSS